MLVKVYKGRVQVTVSVGVRGMHRPMRFWRVRFRALRAPAASALRRGQGPRPFPRTAFSPSGILPPRRSGQVSLDEAGHFPAQSRSQRRYTPMVFGIIPEFRSASLGTGLQLRRNPQWELTKACRSSSFENYRIDCSHRMCRKLQNEDSLFYSEGRIDGRIRAADRTPKSGNSLICDTSG